MRISIFLVAITFSTSGLMAQQQNTAPAVQKPMATIATTNDSVQYMLGAYLGQYIVSNGFSINNADLFLKGLDDVLNNRQLLVNANDIPKWITSYQTKALTERNSLQEKQLFESLKSKTGVGILPSGVCYTIEKAGKGMRPQVSDSILLHVKAFLVDGRQFEDTYVKNNPYRITPASLIAGLSEAVQIMPSGSLWRVYIPASLAFGEKGIQGIVPPQAAVIFEVELVKIIQ